MAGRPEKKDLDTVQIQKLASIHCTLDEIADVMGCDVKTLKKHYSAQIDKGRSQGKIKLRNRLWALAEKENLGALIWLSKQHLGMAEKIEHEVESHEAPKDDEKVRAAAMKDPEVRAAARKLALAIAEASSNGKKSGS